MKIVYARRALRDIDRILAYIRGRSPQGAHNVSIAIEHTIHLSASTATQSSTGCFQAIQA